MPEDKKDKHRRRMVVEEVETSSEEESSEQTEPEKVEEASPAPESQENSSPEEKPQEGESKEDVKEEKSEESHDGTEQKSSENIPPEPPKESKSMVWWILIPGFFLLGALLGGIIFYQKGVTQTESGTEVATPTPSSTTENATPAPSTETKLDLTEFGINILNGSGVPGEAGKVKELLTGSGFKVTDTGNASSYNYTKTVIKAKESVSSEYLTKLSDVLGAVYEVDKPQTLSSSSDDDVQIFVGSSKAK